MVAPSSPLVLFFWSTGNLTPFETAWQPIVHTGRSEPILMVPLLVPPPPPPPPQAKATRVAAVRTISPLARTIWFPLVLVGRRSAKPHLTASHHLPPSSQLASGRECAGGECGHIGMAELLLRGTLSTRRALEVKSKLPAASPLIRKAGAVVHRIGEPPGGSGLLTGRFEDRDHPVGGVAPAVETQPAGGPVETRGPGHL